MTEEKIDETERTVTPPPSPQPSSAKQYILRREIVKHRRNLDPYDVKKVYRNSQQIQRAVQNGTFDAAKTMHMDFTTKNMYWLCYENAVADNK